MVVNIDAVLNNNNKRILELSFFNYWQKLSQGQVRCSLASMATRGATLWGATQNHAGSTPPEPRRQVSPDLFVGKNEEMLPNEPQTLRHEKCSLPFGLPYLAPLFMILSRK